MFPVDFCGNGQHACHTDAECRNGIFNYSCQCKQGFSGDGFNCQGNILFSAPCLIQTFCHKKGRNTVIFRKLKQKTKGFLTNLLKTIAELKGNMKCAIFKANVL